MNIDKIKSFVHKYYKIIIPITLMVVLFISFLVYYQISTNSNYRVEETDSFYQYFYGTKYKYKAIVAKDKKDVVIDFKPQDLKVNLDSTPVYYQKKDTVIFPKDMSVVMPTLNCAEYMTPGYSYITFENKVYNLTTNNYHQRLNHYFLYDGGDLYFFIEPVTLMVQKEEIQLSSFSYVIAKYNGYISYYDKKSDTFKTIDDGDNDATIENDYYRVYVSDDTIDYQGVDVILTSGLSNLNTIDMKDRGNR